MGSIEDYASALRSKYDLEKDNADFDLLVNPSPGNIRKLCLLRIENASASDQRILSLYLNINNEESIFRQVEKVDADKFKPIGNFLKGKTDNMQQVTSLDFVAVLLEFTPRPFQNFRSNGKVKPTGRKGPERDSSYFMLKTINAGRLLIVGVAIVMLFFAGYGLKHFVKTNRGCMQWQGNQYVEMDCEVNGFASSTIEPFDQNRAQLMQIDVNKKTPFFKNGVALVWYCKKDGKIEYFNAAGDHLHPVTGKALHPITDYMIAKYINLD